MELELELELKHHCLEPTPPVCQGLGPSSVQDVGEVTGVIHTRLAVAGELPLVDVGRASAPLDTDIAAVAAVVAASNANGTLATALMRLEMWAVLGNQELVAIMPC